MAIESNPCFAVEDYKLDKEPSEQELLGEINFDSAVLPQGVQSQRYKELEQNDSMVCNEVVNDDTYLEEKNPFICIRETDDQPINELSITVDRN